MKILRRDPWPEDVQDLLCDPPLGDLPDDALLRSRLISCANSQRILFMNMVTEVLSCKEVDERERQGVARA